MLWISPKDVRLFGETLDGVRGVAVSRKAKRVIEEWGETGPFAVFVDASEVSVEVTIEREVRESAPGAVGTPALGEQGTLSFRAAASGASAHGELVEGTVAVVSVSHQLSGGSGPTQRIVCRGVSGDGAADPLAPAVEGSK